MNLATLFTYFSISISIFPCATYRILAIFPTRSKSHFTINFAVLKSMAMRGHQVDVVAHFLPKNHVPNYRTLINLDNSRKSFTGNWSVDDGRRMNTNLIYYISTMAGASACDLMGLKELQDLFHNHAKEPAYDLFITEIFGAHCFLGIGHYLKIPVIATSTSMEYPWVINCIRNEDNPAYVHTIFSKNTEKMDFWNRLSNIATHYKAIYDFYTYTEKGQTKIMRQYLNPDMPSIREIEKTVALVLSNSHPIFSGIKPLLPTLVQVSGIHIEQNYERLSPDLQRWLDESVHGVVCFTMGSMILAETFPQDILLTFYASFERIKPTRVLMKVTKPDMLPPGLPENVRITSWIPQIPVLAHKNTRALITHGGFLSTIEALYFEVPVIGIPVFADQPRNIQSLVDKNMAVMIDINNITEENLDDALKSVLEDSKYKESVTYYSRLYRDRPMTATDSTVYWVEYIIRNGPNILKTSALEYSWWQLASLDIYGFILACVTLVFVITYFILRVIFRKCIIYKLKFESSKKLN